MRWLCVSLAFVAVLSTALRADQAASSPPPTAPGSEQDYDALMKKVGPAYASMSKNLDAGEVDRAEKDAQQLADLLGEAEKFWTGHKRDDAVKWAQSARRQAAQIATAISGAQGYLRSDARIQSGVQARLTQARASVTNLGATCQQCHTAYRAGDAKAGFRIKPGVLGR